MSRAPVVGLLGGIGAGKSTVASIFRKMGAVVVDADEIAHGALKEPGIKAAIRRRWGDGVIGASGEVCRQRLAGEVFRDERSLRELERIVHPAVVAEIKRVIESAGGRQPVVLDAPLLVEAGLAGLCDALLFVGCDPAKRMKRVRRTRGWSRDEADRREAFQASPASKRVLARFQVDNSGDRRGTARQVADIYARLVEKSAGGKSKSVEHTKAQ